MIYFILGFKSFSPTFLVAMSSNFRPPSHQSILCIFYFSPFLNKCTLIEMFLVWLVSFPFLAIHISDLISKIIIGASSGTIYGTLSKKSWISILKFDKAIPTVHDAFYSLSALDWENDPGTCVPWSIGPPWKNITYTPVLVPVFGQSCQLESYNSINWFSVLILSYLNSSDKGASLIS